MKTGSNPAVIYPKKTENLRVKFLKTFAQKAEVFLLWSIHLFQKTGRKIWGICAFTLKKNEKNPKLKIRNDFRTHYLNT